MKGSGIVVQCIACHEKRLLTFDEAAALSDLPICDRCHMPMLVKAARASVSVKAERGK